MMLDIPIRGIRSIYVQLNADLEDLHCLLPVKVVIADEGVDTPFEIMKPVLVVTAVTTSLLVKIPKLCQFPDIVVI